MALLHQYTPYFIHIISCTGAIPAPVTPPETPRPVPGAGITLGNSPEALLAAVFMLGIPQAYSRRRGCSWGFPKLITSSGIYPGDFPGSLLAAGLLLGIPQAYYWQREQAWDFSMRGRADWCNQYASPSFTFCLLPSNSAQ